MQKTLLTSKDSDEQFRDYIERSVRDSFTADLAQLSDMTDQEIRDVVDRTYGDVWDLLQLLGDRERMKRHSIIVRLNPADTKKVPVSDKASQITELRFVAGDRRIGHGIGQMLGQLAHRGMYPPENAIDLAILAAAVTAADTQISRAANAQGQLDTGD